MLTEAVARDDNRKQQVSWHTKPAGIEIVNWIKIVRHEFGKVAALFTRKTDCAIVGSVVLVNEHSRIGAGRIGWGCSLTLKYIEKTIIQYSQRKHLGYRGRNRRQGSFVLSQAGKLGYVFDGT